MASFYRSSRCTARLVAIVLLLLPGCALNAVDDLSLEQARSSDGRVVLVGVERADTSERRLGVSFSEYDPQTGDIGNCFRYDRLSAGLGYAQGFALHAFSVPAGSYGSGILSSGPGRHVTILQPGLYYLGDFQVADREASSAVVGSWLREEWRVARAAAAVGVDPAQLNLPQVHASTVMARLFLCTP